MLRPGWAGGLRGLWFCRFLEFYQLRRRCSATTVHRALPKCEVPALGMSWGTARSNAAYAVDGRCGGACTGRRSRAGQVVCWVVAVLTISGFLQFRRCRLAITVHRALPVCEWPALGMPLGIGG